MSRSVVYRQQVADFRSRLDNILRGAGPKQGRIHIDTTGTRTIRMPFSSNEDLLVRYGEARHHSVARLLALFEIMREVEHLDGRSKKVEVEASGAVWQAFRGTTTMNACHTAPSHLQLDNHLPTLLTRSRGLRRHIIIEFADCMLLPRSINETDSVIDEVVGREAFAGAAETVLNERGADWRQGLDLFHEQMRRALGPVGEALMQARGGELRTSNPDDQEFVDTLGAYYEGLYLYKVNPNQIDNLRKQVESEMAVP